jgi:hypothetical protein
MNKLTACVLGFALAASVARAEESAKAHLDKGMIFYNLQDWPSAIREFKAAYSADPQPGTLFTIAQAQRLSGDCEAAIFSYRTFLRTASGTQSAAAEGLIHQCEATLERTRAEAEAERQRKQQQQQLAALQLQQLQAPQPGRQPEPAAAPRVEVRNTTWYADPLGDVLAVAGLAATGVGAVLLVQGNGSVAPSGKLRLFSDYQSAVTAAQPKQLAGVLALSGGGALLAGAIIRYVVVGRRSPEVPVSLGFLTDPSGATVTVAGHF